MLRRPAITEKWLNLPRNRFLCNEAKAFVGTQSPSPSPWLFCQNTFLSNFSFYLRWECVLMNWKGRKYWETNSENQGLRHKTAQKSLIVVFSPPKSLPHLRPHFRGFGRTYLCKLAGEIGNTLKRPISLFDQKQLECVLINWYWNGYFWQPPRREWLGLEADKIVFISF